MLAVGQRLGERAHDREIEAAVGERQRVLRTQRDRLVEVLDRAVILAEPVKHAAAIGEGDRGGWLQPYHLAVIPDGMAELAQRDMGIAAVEERGGETVVSSWPPAITAEQAFTWASGPSRSSPAQARSSSSRVRAPALDAVSIASNKSQQQRAPMPAPCTPRCRTLSLRRREAPRG
jgi:hypothetical protein